MTLGASACAARHQAKNSATLTLRWPVSILAMIEKLSSSRAASSRWVRPAALRAETSSATTALCSGLLFQVGNGSASRKAFLFDQSKLCCQNRSDIPSEVI